MRNLIARCPLSALLVSAFVLRIINFNWPYFTPEEAGLAIKIRNWIPWVDEVGIRLIFTVLGVLVVYLLYRLVLLFSKDSRLALLSCMVAAVSPPLIYLSKLPNTMILKTGVFNSPLFPDSGLLANINVYRGQGLQIGWPNLIEKLLFNKAYFLQVGFLNWLSSFSPAVIFGQFDDKGVYGITSMGAFPKILIIPFFLGIIYLVREKKKNWYWWLLVILLLPLPFLAVIIAYGLLRLKKRWAMIFIVLAFAETLFNLLIVKPEIKLTNLSRPGWIIPVIKDLSSYQGEKRLVISDDIVAGLDMYLRWYGRNNLVQRTLVINQDNELFRCTGIESANVMVGKRDLAYIDKYINDLKIEKIYYDFVGQPVAFKLEERICAR